jgi:hypothetical protein
MLLLMGMSLLHLTKEVDKHQYSVGMIVGGTGAGKTRTCIDGVFQSIE